MDMTQQDDKEDKSSLFKILTDELHQALSLYWNIATQMLDQSGITVLPPGAGYFSLEKNFFSALFLYSYFRVGIPTSRRILYAAANQCLRGMVTGCDNILDNEYKKTLETDLPEQAARFRSILDIMISDRVLFAILQRGYRCNDLTFDQIQTANFASLRALVKSGAQEASEECGAGKILPPDDIINKIHPYKTGILFQSPWALPDIIEPQHLKNITNITNIKEALFHIGMGCQILDDMVDIAMDFRMNRHNYVISLIHHGNKRKERTSLAPILGTDRTALEEKTLLLAFPHAGKIAATTALTFLYNGTRALFAKKHGFMIDISISMIIQRIGADNLLFEFKSWPKRPMF
ncbi:hypothetical protein [Desulfocicer niacini]